MEKEKMIDIVLQKLKQLKPSDIKRINELAKHLLSKTKS